MKLLILGHTFPEPTTTAAGGRMMQLISLFQAADYDIFFASTAGVSEKSASLSELQIPSEIIKLNDPSFDDYISSLNPSVVLFDRYITEEQFGWRVSEQCPDTLKILDTEDLHFLRKARQEAFKNTGKVDRVNLYTDTAKRELASILRCDCSLIISEFEMTLLIETFKISSKIVFYIPLLVDEISEEQTSEIPSFEQRDGFMTIGNLLHPPNVDALLYLKQTIWPLIRKQLPKATLSIYGNYAPQQIKELHAIQEGFLIKGWATSVEAVMNASKVCLAPLRFGAGIKGKVIDAMFYGTPVVVTKIGAEGIFDTNSYQGALQDQASHFANAAVLFHTDKRRWLLAQKSGFDVCNARFQRSYFSEAFIKHIQQCFSNLQQHREANFLSQILQQQQLNASKYMGKWIEEKNK